MTRIVCQQLAPQVGNLARNRELAHRAVADAVGMDADVVVLPELVTSGYVFESEDEARAAAIRPTDTIFDRWAAEARRGSAIVIAGFCELGEDSNLYNSAAVVDAGGLVGVYRKVHLWDREKLFFTPGSAPPPVFDTPFGRIGLIVCYDLEFPEMTRHLALSGADLIAVPTNWPRVNGSGQSQTEAVIAIATAASNGVFVACCDRMGDERGQSWAEGTLIVDKGGTVLTGAPVEGTVVADVSLDEAADKSAAERADLFGDRRPDLYARLER